MALRNFSATAVGTTLTAGVSNVATTIPVAATTGFPSVPFIAVLEPDTTNEEVVLVTAIVSLNLTVTRGYDSTVAVAHVSASKFQHSFSAIDFREANSFVNPQAAEVFSAWSGVTTGSISVGAGLTTGALNLATVGTGATAIGIGHTNATITLTGAIDLPILSAVALGTNASGVLAAATTSGTGTTLVLTGTPTITTPVIDSISAGTSSTASTLWSTITTGSIAIGAGLTTGALNIAASGTGATPITIGHTNATIGLTGNTTVTGTLAVTGTLGATLLSVDERWNVSATAIATTTTVDYVTSAIWYYTTASTAGACTLNIRGSAGSTLSSILAVNDSVSLTVFATTGAATPGYFSTIQIDGSTTNVTTRWQYGSAPTAGDVSTVDCYTFTIVKTSSGTTPNTYVVFASMAKFG